MTAYFSHYSLADVAYQPHVEYVPSLPAPAFTRPEWMSKTSWQRVNVWLTTHKPTEIGWQCLMNEARRECK